MKSNRTSLSRQDAVKAFRSNRSSAPPELQLGLTVTADGRRKARLIEGDAMSLAYTVSPWTSLGSEQEDCLGPCVRERRLEGVMLSSGQAVGHLLFHEYDVSWHASDFEFWNACDCHSQAATKLAEAVLSGWPIEIAERGLIVEFSRLWVDPQHARGSAWAEPVRQLVQKRWARRGRTQCALLLLKPYPLEFEFNRQLNPRVHAARLAKRTIAMRRLYARALGVQPIRSGIWMWRTFSNRIGEPTARTRRWMRTS